VVVLDCWLAGWLAALLRRGASALQPEALAQLCPGGIAALLG
jgi:hypothetical protein